MDMQLNPFQKNDEEIMSWYCVEEIDLNGVSGVVQGQRRQGDKIIDYPIVLDKDIGICFKIISGPHDLREHAEDVRRSTVPNDKLRVVATEFLESQVVLQFRLTFK